MCWEMGVNVGERITYEHTLHVAGGFKGLGREQLVTELGAQTCPPGAPEPGGCPKTRPFPTARRGST